MAPGVMPRSTDVHEAEAVGYRLDVLGADATDVVRAAGGWLFDRAMAGWTVDVWLADTRDVRPLQILGTRVRPLGDRVLPSGDGVIAAMAVAGGLVVADREVGAEVAGALRTGHTEVVLWGAPWPDLLGGRSGEVCYRLSSAARVFKRQALIASGCADVVVGPTEAMISGGYRPLDSDLVAAGG